MNLAKLMNEISEKYPHHLRWAVDPKRYQIIVDALRADLVLQALDLDKSSRYMTNIQNRILKATQALSLLKQMSASNAERVIELVAPTSKRAKVLNQDLEDGVVAA